MTVTPSTRAHEIAYPGTVSFIDVPSTEFTVSVRIDPHRAIEPHSVETSLTLDSFDMNVDVAQFLMNTIKKYHYAKKTFPNREQTPATLIASPPLSPAPPNTRRLTWTSPMSPGSPLMEALSSVGHIKI